MDHYGAVEEVQGVEDDFHVDDATEDETLPKVQEAVDHEEDDYLHDLRSVHHHPEAHKYLLDS